MGRFARLKLTARTRRLLIDGGVVLLAVVVGAAAFTAVARGRITVGPARLVVSAAPAWSARTVVRLPPLGSVEAVTHRGPVRLDVRLDEIDLVGTAREFERGTLSIPTTLAVGGSGGLQFPNLSSLAWRMVGVGLLIAAAAGALVALASRRSPLVVALATALALVVPAAAMGVTYATWDISAFREPTLRGSLEYAPGLLDVFSTRVASIEKLREQAVRVANDLAAYYADQRSLSTGGSLADTSRVLHISDLHLDPVGAQLAKSLARSYEASLVINTGDLPILGVPAETGVYASLIDTSVPYVYVPGNHDSPASIATLRRLGITVLTTGTVEADGLRIFGVPDPVSRGFGVEPDRELLTRAAEDEYASLTESLRSGEPTPDIVAIHNPLMEDPFTGGLVPIILSGHTHSARYYVTKGTIRLNSGTIGGMPYDPEATGREALPYGASVLYYTAEEPRRLIAIDRIAIYPTGSTTVTRDIVDEGSLR